MVEHETASPRRCHGFPSSAASNQRRRSQTMAKSKVFQSPFLTRLLMVRYNSSAVLEASLYRGDLRITAPPPPCVPVPIQYPTIKLHLPLLLLHYQRFERLVLDAMLASTCQMRARLFYKNPPQLFVLSAPPFKQRFSSRLAKIVQTLTRLSSLMMSWPGVQLPSAARANTTANPQAVSL
ncbi:hypothetical protein LX36DRAFT_127732 [Colletotrichum falcatum]|nr:hypothetical protein LX36DRAFT_127732 [Colletotrichum falcatum]